MKSINTIGRVNSAISFEVRSVYALIESTLRLPKKIRLNDHSV